MGLVMKSSGHEFIWNMAGGQIKRGVNVDQISVLPVVDKSISRPKLPPIALLVSSKLSYESVEHLGNVEDLRRKMDKSFSVFKFQVNFNYEVFLDLSPDLINFYTVYQHFK